MCHYDKPPGKGRRCLRCHSDRGVTTLAVPLAWLPLEVWPVDLCVACSSPSNRAATLDHLASRSLPPRLPHCSRCGGKSHFNVMIPLEGAPAWDVVACSTCVLDLAVRLGWAAPAGWN
jgi:hypothetical protein